MHKIYSQQSQGRCCSAFLRSFCQSCVHTSPVFDCPGPEFALTDCSGFLYLIFQYINSGLGDSSKREATNILFLVPGPSRLCLCYIASTPASILLMVRVVTLRGNTQDDSEDKENLKYKFIHK